MNLFCCLFFCVACAYAHSVCTTFRKIILIWKLTVIFLDQQNSQVILRTAVGSLLARFQTKVLLEQFKQLRLGTRNFLGRETTHHCKSCCFICKTVFSNCNSTLYTSYFSWQWWKILQASQVKDGFICSEVIVMNYIVIESLGKCSELFKMCLK